MAEQWLHQGHCCPFLSEFTFTGAGHGEASQSCYSRSRRRSWLLFACGCQSYVLPDQTSSKLQHFGSLKQPRKYQWSHSWLPWVAVPTSVAKCEWIIALLVMEHVHGSHIFNTPNHWAHSWPATTLPRSSSCNRDHIAGSQDGQRFYLVFQT